MSLLLYLYDNVMESMSDPKTITWTINKPGFLAPIIITYLLFCLKIGPQYMKHRAPYNITKLIQYYNISQVIINAFILVQGFRYLQHYSFICQPVSYTMDPKEIDVANVTWMYAFSKVFDLLDTIFFILRKNFRQVTLLHVYHHVIMAGGLVFMTNFFATGMVIVPFSLNLLVHVFMYTYYFIASLGPKYKKYLWWKRHLTEMQLVQFALGAIYAIISYAKGCGIPFLVVVYYIYQAIVFLKMFGSFYINTYIRPPTVPGSGETEVRQNGKLDTKLPEKLQNGKLENKQEMLQNGKHIANGSCKYH